MCDSVTFTYRLTRRQICTISDLGDFFLHLFGLLIVFIRLLTLSVQHAVQGPTKDLKNSCASLKRLAKVSRPHSVALCTQQYTVSSYHLDMSSASLMCFKSLLIH